MIALGTVEPRKNLGAAARIVGALRARGYGGASLDIVGRDGWGGEADRLRAMPGVTLHGYLAIDRIRELMDAADFFISTSHAEGLGLPLLEAQYSGLPVIAPDAPIFHEVLGDSGVMIDPADADASAKRIAAFTRTSGWRGRAAVSSAANIARWNDLARRDHDDVIVWLTRLSDSIR